VTILVTGGCGYIGSHTLTLLLQHGYSVVVLDNLSNSEFSVISKIEDLCGEHIKFIEGDVRDTNLLNAIFRDYEIKAVIHFAGLKSVSESAEQPFKYYDVNVGGTLSLLRAMKIAGCNKIVFSSSATVYGNTSIVPIQENFPLSSSNPYGESKLVVENILSEISTRNSEWSALILRYFNPIGAHPSGAIGESPKGKPDNLVPYISRVAAGIYEKVLVFGGDYPTKDGTGIRDYIHVMDLASGHIKALELTLKNSGVIKVNLGTGQGYSVLDVIFSFEKVSGVKIPYEIVSRRLGDVGQCYADPTYALEVLNWRAELNLFQMCEDTWRWQKSS
jgi:UDP-glucose 4-epimerase